MSTPGTVQVSDFNPTVAVANTDIFYSQNVNTGFEQKTTALQLQAYVQAPIANSTLPAVPSLDGVETFPLGKGGLFQTTLNAIVNFTLAAISAGSNPTASALTGSEIVPISQGGQLAQTTVAELVTMVASGLAPQRQSIPVNTAGQASYATNGYTPGLVTVFVAGIRLNPGRYQATDGVNIILTDPVIIARMQPGMTLDIDAITSIAVANVASQASVQALLPTNQPAVGTLTGTELVSLSQSGSLFQSTLTKIANFIMGLYAPQRQSIPVTSNGQTTYVTNGYVVGLIEVFVSGIRLDPSQYQALDGVHVVITDPLALANIVTGMLVDISASVSLAVANVATPASVNALIPTTQPVANALTGGELVSVSQGGGLVQSTLTSIATWATQTFAAFTQNATGAVARSIQSEFQDRISAKQFGAKGNALQYFTGSITAATKTFTATGTAFTAADVGKGIAIAGAGTAGATLTTTITGYVSATSVLVASAAITTVTGASFTYGTDDTVALQTFINYLVANRRTGLIPGGIYYISGSLGFPNSQNWGVLGESYGCSQLIQATDNTPILVFGSSGTQAAFDVRVHDLQFGYAGVQSITNTMANPIYFQTGWFHVSFQRLVFNGGYYGILLQSNTACPWGCNWDDLQFGGNISGGAINWAGGLNAVPNNVWGRMVVSAQTMAGPLFNNIKGYNFTIQAIEMLATNLGAQLMSLAPGSIVKIGSMKLENGTYNAAQTLFNFTTGCQVSLGSFTLGNSGAMYMTPASGSVVVFGLGSGGGGGSLDIDYLALNATTLSGSVYAFSSGGNASNASQVNWGQGMIRVKHITFDLNAWVLSNFGGSASADFFEIDDWKNDKLGANTGDASYTATLGDPNITCFETAFTAPRTYALDSNNNQLFNGMYREIRCMGAINGANNLTITCAGVTLLTLNTDGVIVRFTFGRRDASHVYNNWKVTKYNTGIPI
jgi:hypothetical protein